MKHISPTQVAVDSPVRAPTRRALAKQQTRAKVLAAARRLFSEQGYEGATIRDIAAAAGMSTGAVFANFSDKSDLFREIMTADCENLLETMRDAAGKARGVEDALTRVFMAGYGFYKTRLPLARAAFSVWWSQQDGPTLRGLGPVQGMQDLFAEQLAAAVSRGELSQEAEVKLRGQMLFEIYLSNFNLAIFEGWSLEALQTRSRDQIRILLAGARRG
jgi:AcrR family transcriptional regulator